MMMRILSVFITVAVTIWIRSLHPLTTDDPGPMMVDVPATGWRILHRRWTRQWQI